MPTYGVAPGDHPPVLPDPQVAYGRRRPPGAAASELVGRVSSHTTLAPVVRALALADLGLTGLVTVVTGLPWVAIGIEAAGLVGLVAAPSSARRASVGNLLAGACNFANAMGQTWLLRRLSATVIRQARPQVRVYVVGYNVMDLGRAGTGECCRGDSIEVAFDADSIQDVAFVRDDVFPALERAYETAARHLVS